MPKAEVVDITSRRPIRDGALRRMQPAALPSAIAAAARAARVASGAELIGRHGRDH
jgi:hypothetical protein